MISRLLFPRCYHHPLLVVGPGRSGTTVLVNALATHPEVLGGFGESPLTARIGELMSGHEQGEKVEYYRRSLRIPLPALRRRLRALSFETAVGGTLGLGAFFRQARRLSARPFTARRWCVKTFPSREAADGLRALYPDVRFILIVRHPADVIASRMKFHAFKGSEFSEQCRIWESGLRKFLHFKEAADAILVRQEDLARDPRGFFPPILEFAGLAASGACADYCESTLEHPLDAETARGVDVRQVLAGRRPGHEDWPEESRVVFTEICGEVMAALGYQPPFSLGGAGDAASED